MKQFDFTIRQIAAFTVLALLIGADHAPGDGEMLRAHTPLLNNASHSERLSASIPRPEAYSNSNQSDRAAN